MLFRSKEQLDAALLLHKLKQKFSIERLMIAGGMINWTFLQAGLIDEVSVVVAPMADGGRTAVSAFEKADFLPWHKPVAFTLKEVKQLPEEVLWLRYIPKKQNDSGKTEV